MNMNYIADNLVDLTILDIRIDEAKAYLRKLRQYRRLLKRIEGELRAIAEMEANIAPPPPSADFVENLETLAEGQAVIEELIDKFNESAAEVVDEAAAEVIEPEVVDEAAAEVIEPETSHGLIADLQAAIAESRRNYAELLDITTALLATDTPDTPEEADAGDRPVAALVASTPDTPEEGETVTQQLRETFEMANANYLNLLDLATGVVADQTEELQNKVIDLRTKLGDLGDRSEDDATDTDDHSELRAKYAAMGVRALRLLCRDRGVRGAARLTKNQCIEALIAFA